MGTTKTKIGLTQAFEWLRQIVGPDFNYVRVGIVYTVAISLLSLATPISVQLLINSVANIALPTALWSLAGVLLLLLLIVVALSAFRVHLMAMYERRIYARLVAEITVRAVHAQNPFFSDANRADLFNRYFDLTVVQKAVPGLMIGAFTTTLQGVVGLTVTSFYHPFFLAFNIVLVTALLLVWLIWRRGALTTRVALSHAKYDTARWLESIGGSNGFYKSVNHLDFAMDRSEAVTATWLAKHKAYFRYSFTQTVCFLLLYALASAALLALGGNLILEGQLSIGQLVAAELILSGVFYGVSQLGYYLDMFYDLVAASEELSMFFDIPQEQARPMGERLRDGAVRLRGVELEDANFNFAIDAGDQLVTVTEPGVDRLLNTILKRHVSPSSGLVTVGGTELAALDMYLLRSDVMVLERPTIVEVTIREYLSLAAPAANASDMLDAIEQVGLSERLETLKDGMDTLLASSGYPLSIGEVMELKLANALLSRPRILVLSQLFDLMPIGKLVGVLRKLKASGTTVLLCTGRPEAITLDGWFWLGRDRQQRFSSLAEFQAFLTARRMADADPA